MTTTRTTAAMAMVFGAIALVGGCKDEKKATPAVPSAAGEKSPAAPATRAAGMPATAATDGMTPPGRPALPPMSRPMLPPLEGQNPLSLPPTTRPSGGTGRMAPLTPSTRPTTRSPQLPQDLNK